MLRRPAIPPAIFRLAPSIHWPDRELAIVDGATVKWHVGESERQMPCNLESVVVQEPRGSHTYRSMTCAGILGNSQYGQQYQYEKGSDKSGSDGRPTLDADRDVV